MNTLNVFYMILLVVVSIGWGYTLWYKRHHPHRRS